MPAPLLYQLTVPAPMDAANQQPAASTGELSENIQHPGCVKGVTCQDKQTAAVLEGPEEVQGCAEHAVT
jgi:hypothetical protein